jgi:lactoylglutathione lyase
MKLHHIAFWTRDIERLVTFYQKHFSARELFRHESGDFRCAFIQLPAGERIEIMTRSHLPDEQPEERVGYSHLSFEVESKAEVDRLTEYFQGESVQFEKVKQQYDDGFYESSILDPDGNIIEIAFVDPLVNPHV